MWDSIYSYDSIAKYYRNGEFKGGVFAGSGGNQYTYVVNMDLNVIEFSTNVPPVIIGQYLASPSRVNGKYVVNPLVSEALLKYIWWADNSFKSTVSEVEKARMFNAYVTAKTYAKMRVISPTSGDMKDSRARGTSLTIK
jgi:hypothetical protein